MSNERHQGYPKDGLFASWVDWVSKKLVIPLLVWLAATTILLGAELERKKDSLEASREHSELREGLLSAQLLRDQPPEWFIRWAANLDARLRRIEERQ